MQGGRERRRKGVINRVRRLCYGVALSLTSHVACAESAGWRPLPPPASPRASSDPWFNDSGGGEPAPQLLDDLSANLRLSASLLGDPGPVALRAHNDNSLLGGVLSGPLYALKDGARLDLTLPELGQLHLDLFAKRNSRHWELNPDAAVDDPVRGAWSLGGAVEMVKIGEHGHRQLTVTPQLVLDIDKLTGAPGQFEATVQYGHWRARDDRGATDERVPQASLRWKF